MAKRFGRNQKRKLKEQLAAQQIEAQVALASTLDQVNEVHSNELDNMRGRIRALDNRNQYQVVIDLSRDVDLMSGHGSIRAGLYSHDHRHEPVASAYSYDRQMLKYTLSKNDQNEAIVEMATIIARMLGEDLFGHMRNSWDIGYGRDVEPYERYGRSRY